VIYGTPFPSITSVPWIERDHYHAGKIAAGRLLRHGSDGLTVLTREKPMPGDYRMLMACGRNGSLHLPIGDIAGDHCIGYRSVRFAVTDLLKNPKSGQGFICRSKAARRRGFTSNRRRRTESGCRRRYSPLFGCVSSAGARPELPFPYLMSAMSPEVNWGTKSPGS